MNKPFEPQRQYHARLLEEGRTRMPGGFLTAKASAALDALTVDGMSKSAVINAALIEYAKKCGKTL
ncbi:hypothetical protein [Kerstersia gyiorum]|jgi:hypothetical protein|uniref:Uncharacterized protein n=1 Tax=Kerstersia gyiorum TaxID=206506 RepID=A0A171KST4_9BURK|nr:hypothetical protein [Kerstersia gyiorum]MCO7638517.1 hypothetical protein [Pseudomonas sp. S 311-6]KKO71951.1 hypothetical protein AAV32_08250 [Kerstersia gyiorum]MCH4271722.1 hypothetical protein [Kerstersia gyiorum]MCI1227578.1 hypothetical protein [Kerstersia gyiorum]MCP1633568.1 hypothetical protein [Kerstersia gyiorum]